MINAYLLVAVVVAIILIDVVNVEFFVFILFGNNKNNPDKQGVDSMRANVKKKCYVIEKYCCFLHNYFSKYTILKNLIIFRT